MLGSMVAGRTNCDYKLKREINASLVVHRMQRIAFAYLHTGIPRLQLQCTSYNYIGLSIQISIAIWMSVLLLAVLRPLQGPHYQIRKSKCLHTNTHKIRYLPLQCERTSHWESLIFSSRFAIHHKRDRSIFSIICSSRMRQRWMLLLIFMVSRALRLRSTLMLNIHIMQSFSVCFNFIYLKKSRGWELMLALKFTFHMRMITFAVVFKFYGKMDI